MEIEEAIKILCKNVLPIKETEEVSLIGSNGRILAEDVCAEFDQPPFSRSPLDGYAVKGVDTLDASEESPVTLKVIGKVYVGEVYKGKVSNGEAVRIMTGAPIPDGADTVIRQEDTDYGAETVGIYKGQKPWSNYCHVGEDFKKGEVILEKDLTVNSGIMAVLASLGKNTVRVYRKPRVAVFSTGDELLMPGSPVQPGKIYESNNTYISSRLMEYGLEPVTAEIVPDDPYLMAEKIQKIADNTDLVITTGGVSVGEKDIMHDVQEILQAKKLFWKVKVKPGSPTLAFMYKDTLVLALSGNAFAAVANFEILGRNILYKMYPSERIRIKSRLVTMKGSLAKPSGMKRFLRGYADDDTVVFSEGLQTSGAISGMAHCNCLIEIPSGKEGAKSGETVRIYEI